MGFTPSIGTFFSGLFIFDPSGLFYPLITFELIQFNKKIVGTMILQRKDCCGIEGKNIELKSNHNHRLPKTIKTDWSLRLLSLLLETA